MNTLRKKANIVVFTQNLKLASISGISSAIDGSSPIVLITSHCLFENEKQFIRSMIGEFESYTFASFLSDKEMEKCDHDSYSIQNQDIIKYYSEIKSEKNKLIISKILEKFEPVTRLLLCDDLGIDKQCWLENGFDEAALDYYFIPKNNTKEKKMSKLSVLKHYLNAEIYSAKYQGKKYVFYGRMDRIGYRMNIDFKRDKAENRRFVAAAVMKKLIKTFPVRKNTEHISTLHESTKWRFPELKNYSVGLIQDGYLPPNYSSFYLKFINSNEHYYAWDTLGMQVFNNQGIPVKMLPFRKKKYIPEPDFKPVRNVLCVASGAGDWTAMKNRSDEDMMIIAFVEMAKRHPEIRFVYRCHPTWIHYLHQGVNSINRVAEYFKWLDLPNLVLSGNIPSTDLNDFQLSFSRNSLEQDLKDADIVFGEHSVSMIDAAFKKIPFASVNMTGRRDFFCGMTELGFPHCESIEEIENVINGLSHEKFISDYKDAVKKYNMMTDEE